MAWNEPGKGGNPWNSGGDQGPPDLDKVVADLQKKLSGLFGGRGRGSGDSEGAPGGGGSGPLWVLIAIGLAVWGFTGFYTVDDAERGVVMQFGKYHKTTTPGLHWHIPAPIQTVTTVNVSEVDSYNHSTRMLTADENIVDVDVVVQFRKADPQAVLFNIRDPEATLAEVSESAIREVVGASRLDFVLTEGRAEIAQSTKELVQSTLDQYGSGIEVTSVNLLEANFPNEVQASVQDAIKAREDRDRLRLEAESYANDVVPRARGTAARQMEDSEAYRERVIADAEGEAARFLSLLVEYQKAPEVTRDRLYLETLEQVMGASNKVILDAEGSGNLLYLPMDQLMRGSGAPRVRPPISEATVSPGRTSDQESARRTREDRRSRGNR